MSKPANPARMTLVQVAAYQTSDGKTHLTRGAAATHEGRIGLRAFMNRHVSGTARTTDKIEINELLNILERNREELATLLRAQSSEINRITNLEKTLAAKKAKSAIA